MSKIFFLLMVCFVFIGCATSSRITKISLGMTKEDIIAAYGEPHSTKVEQDSETGETIEVLTYKESLYDTPVGQMGFKPSAKHYTTISLTDGRVADYNTRVYAPKTYKPSTYEPDPAHPLSSHPLSSQQKMAILGMWQQQNRQMQQQFQQWQQPQAPQPIIPIQPIRGMQKPHLDGSKDYYYTYIDNSGHSHRGSINLREKDTRPSLNGSKDYRYQYIDDQGKQREGGITLREQGNQRPSLNGSKDYDYTYIDKDGKYVRGEIELRKK